MIKDELGSHLFGPNCNLRLKTRSLLSKKLSPIFPSYLFLVTFLRTAPLDDGRLDILELLHGAAAVQAGQG